MADLSDVEREVMNVVVRAIYPGGTTVPSITNGDVKIYRGWPSPVGLNADLAKGISTVSIFSDPKLTRETTRYPRVWRTSSITAPSLTASTLGRTITFGGIGGAGQVAGITVDTDCYALTLSDSDTPSSVAAFFAKAIVGAIVTGPNIVVPGMGNLCCRVVGSGVSIMETRRQEQRLVVSIWCADPVSRDVLAGNLDCAFSPIDWVHFSDGSAGKLSYRQTSEIDSSENASLYRRDLCYDIEYPTIICKTSSEMLFGSGVLTGLVADGASIASAAAAAMRPLLGAIRFDAWYDPMDVIDQQCAAALSDAKWSMRLPSNASVSSGGVSWPVADQAVIDGEIAAAVTAGLDFWAFDSYQPADGLSRALDLYLRSPLRSHLQFCMLGQISNWSDPQAAGGYSAVLLRDLEMMGESGYLATADGRPVYFVLDADAAQLSSLPGNGIVDAIRFVRRCAASRHMRDPYIIWLSAAALADYDNTIAAREAGADAAGAYACPRLSGETLTYADLVRSAEADWAARARTGFSMIPTAMTGWDQRPLIETPQPFYPIAPGLSASDYYLTGSDADIAQHISDLATFVAANSAACPVGIGLVYAWNELAEGGWLMPTLSPNGPDTSRASALGRQLSSWRMPDLRSVTFTA